MSRQIKNSAIIILLLSALFFAFFDRSKHVPALAAVNSFGTDPYDAVGSFGVQLAIFGALLTMLRAFRPYSPEATRSIQAVLILRGMTVVLLSVAVTLAADLVAVVRYRSMTTGSAEGWTLAALVAGLAILTGLAGRLLDDTARKAAIPAGASRAWTGAIIVCLVSVLILAVYPAGWDQGVPGGILTALLGMVIFVVNVWILATNLFPKIDPPYEDVIDDLVAIYQWFRGRAGFARGFLKRLEKMAGISLVPAIFNWLNPRQHKWHFMSLIAVAMGLTLAAVEALSEGGSSNLGLFVIVASVFIGIESAGILLGYGLLSKYLGLFRRSSSL
jgi:hypothetical protein